MHDDKTIVLNVRNLKMIKKNILLIQVSTHIFFVVEIRLNVPELFICVV